MKKYIFLLLIASLMIIPGCTGYNKSNTASQLFYGLFFSTSPVLNNLAISASDANSITLAQPTFLTSGNSTPSVNAYIGLNGTITITGSTVSNSLQGPIDVSASQYQFPGLTPNTSYRIIVVAVNSIGYSVQQISQSTGSTAPVLNNLAISAFDEVSITLAQPTFSTAGNPSPSVQAYIGLDGTITVAGSVVSNYVQGPIEVSSSAYQFTGLVPNTPYRIIVVAWNAVGYSVQQIAQSTGGIAPILNNLAITTFDDVSITLTQPTFSTTGNPSPSVQAYIGLDGTIAVAGSVVSSYVQGPIEVSSGSYQFNGLVPNTPYRIIVVAQNTVGYSVQQIAQSTGGIAPVLNNLAITTFDNVSITLTQPTFSTAGNPSPSVQAYIGLDGTIAVAGSVVNNYVQGPIEVSSGSYQFNGLVPNTPYRIIVVAQNTVGYSVQQIAQSTGGVAPVLNNLAITTFDNVSITLTQPTFSTAGNPSPSVQAYIGLDGTIAVAGSVVSSYVQGPIEVSSGSYQFNGLVPNTPYRIIVVAQNTVGYSVQQIAQSTGGIAPVLNNLAITTFDNVSITLTQPTFSTAGNPSPSVQAYIGLDGTIAVAGSVVSNYVQGPIEVSSGSYQFNGLVPNTPYRIIVVAQNTVGYSVQQIAQSTGGVAPVLSGLVIITFDAVSITLQQPGFTTTGIPSPSVQTYIGLNDGSMTIAGDVVSGSIQGPIEVSSGDYMFTGLASGTDYLIIVVAWNTVGYSVEQITETTL